MRRKSDENKSTYERGKALCESPIEEKMYEYLSLYFFKTLHIETQKEILNYRVDFLLTDKENPNKKLIVECDGWDYHERTKEQAINDRKRDRELTKAGFKLYRFLGSEIYSNIDSCLNDISNFFKEKENVHQNI